MSSKEILVSIALGGENIRIGKLLFHVKGHKESASFEYDKEWLDHPEKFALEPALKLTEGAFHTSQGINLFGGFGRFRSRSLGACSYASRGVIKSKRTKSCA